MNHNRYSPFVAVAALVVVCGALFAADSKPPTKQSYEERYRLLTEENMFLRDRRKPASRPIGSGNEGGPPRVVRAPETLYVLRGVVLEGDQFRAYIEDVTNAKMLRLAVGDLVARGHVAAIDIDAIAYEATGQITWVNVGADLKGQVATSSSTPTPRVAPSTTASTPAATTEGGTPAVEGGAAAVDPNSLSLEEKMRRRRLEGK